MELLRRVAEAKGRLLRVQCYRDRGTGKKRGKGGKGGGSTVTGLLLTFDIGRVLVWADPEQVGHRPAPTAEPAVKESSAQESELAELSFMHVEYTEDLHGGLVELDEEEPWWRVLGSPLIRVRARRDPAGVCLQFRDDEHNPRIVELTRQGRLIGIELRAWRETR
jgi:hypothetical protein